jgi:DNA-binding transcriptional MerR regulator
MDKSPEAFRTISEVAEALDVPPHVLRFWETRFAQVKPVKRGGGRRYYRPEDVRLLRGIRGLLYDDGMTIKGVQKILRERGIRHVIGLGTLPEPEPEGPPAAPAAAERPAAAPANGGRAAPQGDLFDTGPAAVMTAPAAAALRTAPAPDASPKPLDKPALKRLLAELIQLREVMTGEPRR